MEFKPGVQRLYAIIPQRAFQMLRSTLLPDKAHKILAMGIAHRTRERHTAPTKLRYALKGHKILAMGIAHKCAKSLT